MCLNQSPSNELAKRPTNPANSAPSLKTRVNRLLHLRAPVAKAVPAATDTVEPAKPSTEAARRHQLQSGLNRNLARQPVGQLPAALDLLTTAAEAARPSDHTPRHVIMVLGIQVQIEGRPNPRMELRMQNAYRLACKYPDAHLVVSGAYVPGPFDAPSVAPLDPKQLVEANTMRCRLQELGVAAYRIHAEPRAQHTVGNIAYGYQVMEAELMPVWGQIDHITLAMEPYHAPRAARIAATLLASLPNPPALHLGMSERMPPHLLRTPRRLAKGKQVLLRFNAEQLANLTRCQREKIILAAGW